MVLRLIPIALTAAFAMYAQENAPATPPAASPSPKSFLVEPGTHIPLSLINSIVKKLRRAIGFIWKRYFQSW